MTGSKFIKIALTLVGTFFFGFAHADTQTLKIVAFNTWGVPYASSKINERSKEAMKEISDADYLKTLSQQLEKRKKQVKNDKNWLPKTAQHLIGKGYEPELVWRELKNEETE